MVRCRENGRKALYVASETFTNELILAIRTGGTADFRSRYRDIDVLLIDDIHFIIGKESTQEEFFHTFNWLYDKGKQIVLSSDRAPNRMNILDERLRQRFWWGLTADIEAPDFETRIEILRRKARLRGRTLSDDVLQALAGRMSDNVRELEGCVQPAARARRPSPGGTVGGSHGDHFQWAPAHQKVSGDEVLLAVAAYYPVSEREITGASRSRAVSAARQVAMFLLRTDSGWSLPQIGSLFGGRDHSTVVYPCQRIRDRMESDEQIRRDVEARSGPASASLVR